LHQHQSTATDPPLPRRSHRGSPSHVTRPLPHTCCFRVPETSAWPVTIAVTSPSMPQCLVLLGSASSSSLVITVCLRTFCVSTSGLAPLTVTVSCNEPTARFAFTVAVNPE